MSSAAVLAGFRVERAALTVQLRESSLLAADLGAELRDAEELAARLACRCGDLRRELRAAKAELAQPLRPAPVIDPRTIKRLEVLLEALPYLAALPTAAIRRGLSHTYLESLPGWRAFELLTVLADDLQARGEALGLWLALLLAGAPCEACDVECEDCGWHGRYGHKTGCKISDDTGPCASCHGHGTALAAALLDAVAPCKA